MKTGPEYWGSKEKRLFDLAVAGPCVPALGAAELILRKSVDDSKAAFRAPFWQPRVGRGDGQPEARQFMIKKLQTLDDEGVPLSRAAELFRKLGIDELAQLSNIWRGEMSVCGYRPVVLKSDTPGITSYEEVMDNVPAKLGNAWAKMTQLQPPGILSSFGLYQHVADNYDNIHEIRVEMDLRDAYEESLGTNIRLVKDFAELALRRRLQ